MVKTKNLGQRDSIECKVFNLHVAHPGSIPDTADGSQGTI